MLLAPGDYSLKVIVRDPDNGTSGLRLRTITVRDFDAPGVELSTPCLLAAKSEWVNLKGGAETGGGAAGTGPANYPVTFKNRPFVLMPGSMQSEPNGQPLLLKLYNAPVDPATGRPRVQVSWRILSEKGDSEGAPQCDLVSINSTGGNVTEMMFSLRPPSLAPGSHVLSVTVEDQENRKTVSEAIPFQIGS